jgi:protein MpaA
MVVAGFHGDEAQGSHLVSAALRMVDPDEVRASVVVSVNPDGCARGVRGNARGVDINRNWPATNWSAKPVRYRWTLDDPPEIELSPGSKPSSEPETVALMRLIDRFEPRAVVSVHVSLACVDDPNETPYGNWLAERTGLKLVRSVGYPTPGSFGSWGQDTGLPIITLELPDAALRDLYPTFLPVLSELIAAETPPRSARERPA